MRFDVEEFRKKAREDFEHAWHEGPSVLTPALLVVQMLAIGDTTLAEALTEDRAARAAVS